MPQQSDALTELQNLRQLTDQHKDACHDPECGVSVYIARSTALRLAHLVHETEKADAREIVRSWPL